jgi:hypothetical protein
MTHPTVRRAQWLALSAATLALLGCPKADDGGDGSGDGGQATDVAQQVELACGRCHTTPPPDSLPKARWPAVIASMKDIPGGRPPDDEERAAAASYYASRAPEDFDWVAPESGTSTKLKFEVEGFTPPNKKLQEAGMPAVANVRWAFLSDGKRRDLLIADMRTSMLMMLSPWREEKQRRIRRLAGELNYPAHVELTDVNGDRGVDLVVAAHGQMNPGNETQGGVAVLFQRPNHKFVPKVVAKGLGRPADAQAADLDGDGDQDLAVTAFGWRGPGKLLVLEQTSEAGTFLSSFQEKELDDRDGFIHVDPVDLNGDGKLDLVATLSQEHEQIVVFVNEGQLNFARKTLWAAPHPSWGSSGQQVVDLDGDGDLDVLLSNGDSLDDDLLKPYHGVSWLKNEGSLKFTHEPIGQLYGCERAVAADLDGDGDQDVVAVSFLPQHGPSLWQEKNLDSVVWFEQQRGKWVRHSLEKANNYHPTVDAADYDGDGKVDIAVGNFVWLEGDPNQGTPNAKADYVTLFTQR